MSDTFTLPNGVEYPSAPTETTYMEFYTTAEVQGRWIHYVNGDYDCHFQYVGKCQCNYCDYWLWAAVPGMPQSHPISQIIGGAQRQATREELQERHIFTSANVDWLPMISPNCMTRDSRLRSAMESGREHEARRFCIIQPEHFAEVAARMEEEARKEREKHARWLEPHPVCPVEGALVLHDGKFVNFTGWTDDGKIMLSSSEEAVPAEEVSVLTSLVYGVPHENAVVMPSNGNGHVGKSASIVRYDRINATVKMEDGTTRSFPVNDLALMVPALNPATESTKDRVKRLDRELERLKLALRHRMVAEGETRSWCSEFDPILDSNGLAPRRPKVRITGVIHFSYESDSPIAPGTVTKMRNGTHNVGSVIPSDKMRLVECEQTEPQLVPILS